MMENVVEQLFSLPNLILCMMIWILVWLLRRVVERVWKGAKANKLWNELALPVSPMAMGALIGAAIPQYPYPEDFKTFWARIFFCVVCGLVSAHAYKIVKKLMKKDEPESKEEEEQDDPTDILDDKDIK